MACRGDSELERQQLQRLRYLRKSPLQVPLNPNHELTTIVPPTSRSRRLQRSQLHPRQTRHQHARCLRRPSFHFPSLLSTLTILTTPGRLVSHVPRHRPTHPLPLRPHRPLQHAPHPRLSGHPAPHQLNPVNTRLRLHGHRRNPPRLGVMLPTHRGDSVL
jgi:hypothetical protein